MVVLTLTLLIGLGMLLIMRGPQRLLALREMSFRMPLLPVVACGAQAVGVANQPWRVDMIVLSAGCLGLFYWHNRKRAGMLLVACGALMNLSVMVANHGAMPISAAAVARVQGVAATPGVQMDFSKDEVFDEQHTYLAWFDDHLTLPGPLARLAAWSWGDVVLLVGAARMIWIGTATRAARIGTPETAAAPNKRVRLFGTGSGVR